MTSMHRFLTSGERGDREEAPLSDAGRELNAFRAYDDFDSPKMAPDDDETGGYFNRIPRRRPTVNRAKDLFDECRSTEECSATNPYLECVNRLCSCPPPHVLKDHADCVSGTTMQDWLSWLIPVSVFAATGVGIALYLISKRKKTGTGSGESDDNDTDNAPAAEAGAASCRGQQSRVQQQVVQAPSNPRYNQYGGDSGTTAAAGGGYQASDVLGRLPPMKEWVRFPRGAKGNTQCTLSGGTGGGGAADHNRVMWAQQAFTTLASPLYQNKLVKRLMAGKGASGSYPDSSTSGAEPHQALTARRPASPPPQPTSRYCEAPLLSTPLPDPIRRAVAYGGRSSQQLQRSPLAATCSDEASSFRSFPVAGRSEKSSQRYAVEEDDEAENEAPPARLRSRSSSRYAAREPRPRSESSEGLQSPPSRRKVFFANYKK
ncbi:hypothetical protein V5799_023769 [Amblyomma americanum]|uniref:Uncharacterized protein n=1 Tax=Amblyomma americanum TaxID=6943 RepID=A0AAQ4FI29_AMBAM